MSLFAIGASIDEVYAEVLAREFYQLMKIDDDRSQIVALTPMIYTTAIVYGVDETGMAGRYCYTTATAAILAFMQWSGNAGTDPEGWIRHPESGRRRPLDPVTGLGDATQERIHG